MLRGKSLCLIGGLESVFIEAPGLRLLTQHQMVGVKTVYLQPDICKGLEAEVVFH